jgi:hypothetical protein
VTTTNRTRPPPGGRTGGLTERHTVTPSSLRRSDRRASGLQGSNHEGGLNGAQRPTASRPRPRALRRNGSTRKPIANRLRPASRRQLRNALGHERADDGGTRTGRTATLCGSAPHANASAWRDDGPTSDGPLPSRTQPKQEERAPTNRRRTPSGGRLWETRNVFGHERSRRKGPRARTATSEEARQDHQATMK